MVPAQKKIFLRVEKTGKDPPLVFKNIYLTSRYWFPPSFSNCWALRAVWQWGSGWESPPVNNGGRLRAPACKHTPYHYN